MSRVPQDDLAHVKGDEEKPLLDQTIPALLAKTVAKFGARDAAVFSAEDLQWSYAKFAGQVDRLATGLLRLGVTRGDRVGIWSPNRSEWLLTQFATARIGAILVCVNPAYRAHELRYALDLVGCHTLILAPGFKGTSYVEMIDGIQENPATRLAALEHRVVMGAVPHSGMIAFNDLLEDPDRNALDTATGALTPDDPINTQFTSGTTGHPKGATLTHRNIVNNAHFVTETMQFAQADRLCIPVPFYHCFGMVMGTLGCVSKGATMVVPGEGFDPAATLKAVSDESCTALYGVSTMFVAELGLPDFDTYDLSHLRTGIMAGGPCPVQVMRDVQTKMNMVGITIAYGMTETSPVSFQSAPDDPLDRRVSSVGRVHPHVEVKVIREDGTTAAIGEQGELMTRGYSVMQGYWGDEAKTTNAIDAEGWMHTGDLGVIDADGYAEITGRSKDMICRGGENIYPREIEEFLYTHPAISEVQVFGIPDARLSEVVCAWVIPTAGAAITEDEVRGFCKGAIAHYKVPLHVRIRAEFPMTVTGKPQKFMMRDAMVAELGEE